MILKAKHIVCEEEVINGYMEIEDTKIKRIFTELQGEKVDIDVGDNTIIPGIFDTHNHGTQGYSLMGEVDEAEVKGYLKGLAAQGVTSIFPTCDIKAIKRISEMADDQQDGAKILGIHSEGPWLNRVGEKGIPSPWPEVSVATINQMIADGNGKLRLVALAPEIPGIDAIIDILKQNTITIAYAHSDYTYTDMNKAVEKGISVATHLGNVMTGLHHRDIGGFGAGLLNDAVTCELICDGLHISLPMIEIIMRVKEHDKIMMISDSTPMAGAPAGRYRGFETIPYLNVNEEGFVLSDEGRLCGSSKGVLYGIYNLVEKLHMSLTEVVKMSSLTACQKYGFADNKGSLVTGKDADFVVIDKSYQVLQTYSEGRKIYDQKIDTNVFNTQFLQTNRLP